MSNKVLINEEINALIDLINKEQIVIINDEENEFWNTIRRKLRNQLNESLS